MFAFGCVWMANNVAAGMVATGAFEIVVGDRTIYSKLETGRLPNAKDVIDGLRRVGLTTPLEAKYLRHGAAHRALGAVGRPGGPSTKPARGLDDAARLTKFWPPTSAPGSSCGRPGRARLFPCPGAGNPLYPLPPRKNGKGRVGPAGRVYRVVNAAMTRRSTTLAASQIGSKRFPGSTPDRLPEPSSRNPAAGCPRRAARRWAASGTGITARAGAVQIRTAVRCPREFNVDRRRPVRLGPVVLARRRVRQAVVVGLVAVGSFIIHDAELHFQVRGIMCYRDGSERLGRDPVGAQMEIILGASFRHDHAEPVQGIYRSSV